MIVMATCPQCRGTRVERGYTFGNGWLKCLVCGWTWR